MEYTRAQQAKSFGGDSTNSLNTLLNTIDKNYKNKIDRLNELKEQGDIDEKKYTKNANNNAIKAAVELQNIELGNSDTVSSWWNDSKIVNADDKLDTLLSSSKGEWVDGKFVGENSDEINNIVNLKNNVWNKIDSYKQSLKDTINKGDGSIQYFTNNIALQTKNKLNSKDKAIWQVTKNAITKETSTQQSKLDELVAKAKANDGVVSPDEYNDIVSKAKGMEYIQDKIPKVQVIDKEKWDSMQYSKNLSPTTINYLSTYDADYSTSPLNSKVVALKELTTDRDRLLEQYKGNDKAIEEINSQHEMKKTKIDSTPDKIQDKVNFLKSLKTKVDTKGRPLYDSRLIDQEIGKITGKSAYGLEQNRVKDVEIKDAKGYLEVLKKNGDIGAWLKSNGYVSPTVNKLDAQLSSLDKQIKLATKLQSKPKKEKDIKANIDNFIEGHGLGWLDNNTLRTKLNAAAHAGKPMGTIYNKIDIYLNSNDVATSDADKLAKIQDIINGTTTVKQNVEDLQKKYKALQAKRNAEYKKYNETVGKQLVNVYSTAYPSTRLGIDKYLASLSKKGKVPKKPKGKTKKEESGSYNDLVHDPIIWKGMYTYTFDKQIPSKLRQTVLGKSTTVPKNVQYKKPVQYPSSNDRSIKSIFSSDNNYTSQFIGRPSSRFRFIPVGLTSN